MSTIADKPRDPIPPGRAVIVLTCAGVGPALTIRIRRLLKTALRAHGLRCESVELPQSERQEGGGQ